MRFMKKTLGILIPGIILTFLLITISYGAEIKKWWDKFGTPKYGGTLNVAMQTISGDLDPQGLNAAPLFNYEKLFGIDWAIDRDTWDYSIDYVPPEYNQGLLVETWEMTDPTTMTMHLRKGVKWHNKPPVNGREMTADDIVYSYDRLLGTGHGFTQPNPIFASGLSMVDRVVAADDYTIQFKFKKPSIIALDQVFNGDFGAPSILFNKFSEHGMGHSFWGVAGRHPGDLYLQQG